ncbi:dentin sialophosphoprotein-like [Macrobrachium rosenbergii]|uniref:dentin sialophosphoprotein-like n=1 Tax=Macrobrachium rosenbergii TaxID=79674 RepID=UPI0034D65B21
MEPQNNKQSPSPSGSEEMESDGDSEQEDELENDRSRDSDGDNAEDSDKENSDNSDDDDDDDDEDDDDDDEDESEAEEGIDDSETQKTVSNNSSSDKNSETPFKGRKSSSGSYDDSPKLKEAKPKNLTNADVDCYPLDDLPLEVITTVEPTNYSYPVLKNMSNGVLTHRNIFTEHERAVLRDIINKYRNIVDTRSRTREIYLEKQSVWQQIVEEYNSTENIMVRTEKELRKCWDNMKYRAKQAEKEMMFKTEKLDMNYDGVDLHILAQHAIEEAVKLQQGGTSKSDQADATVKAEPGVAIKMEPVENHDADEDDVDSNPELPDGENSTPADEDREPALKRARQESPKLSSLLLAATQKHSPFSKKNGGKSNHKKSINKFSYNIPECTKVVHMKKKSSQGSTSSAAATGLNSVSDLPVSILPKGLGACLSITNIPNPVSGANHISSNYSYQHKDVSPPLLTSSMQHSMKPMPSLRKMVPGKHQTNGNCKSFSGRSSKRLSSHGMKDKTHNLNNSISVNMGQSSNTLTIAQSSNTLNIGQSSNAMNSVSSMHGMNSLMSSGSFTCDTDKNDSPDKLLSMKLTSQRLEFERREHELKMKLLEKELQSQTYQSQYWALKLKLLRSGRESNAFNLAGATNGDID